MKFNRTLTAIAVAATLALGSANVLAANHSLDINIEANVANEGLLVSPVAGWHNNTQSMSWDHANQNLTPINRQITMRNTTGLINAYLLAPAKLTNGANSIELAIKVNRVPLTTNPVQVVAAGDAATVRNVDFNVTAKAPATPATWVTGNYAGTVYLMFEGP